MSSIFASCPQLNYSIHDQMAEQDGNDTRAAIRFTWSTVHDKEFMGLPPTGKKFAVSSMAIYRVRNGKITELHVLDDYLSLFRQLGAVPIAILQQEMVVQGVNEKRAVPVVAA